VKYLVQIEGLAEITVELDGSLATVGGVAREARLTAIPGTPLYQLELAGRSRTLAAEPKGDGWVLVLRGDALVVRATPEHRVAVASSAGRAPRGRGTLAAPLPGLIVRIAAVAGQRVEAGAPVVVMEAMKMENELRAPYAATVAQVLVAPGDRVERGAPLLVFE